MSYLTVLSNLGVFAREAVNTNLWGVACPFHCQGSSLSLAIASLLLGFILGVSLCIAIGLWIFFPVTLNPPVSPSVQPPARGLQAESIRRRLQGYRALHEPTG